MHDQFSYYYKHTDHTNDFTWHYKEGRPPTVSVLFIGYISSRKKQRPYKELEQLLPYNNFGGNYKVTIVNPKTRPLTPTTPPGTGSVDITDSDQPKKKSPQKNDKTGTSSGWKTSHRQTKPQIKLSWKSCACLLGVLLESECDHEAALAAARGGWHVYIYKFDLIK